jgi:hypothetical protein
MEEKNYSSDETTAVPAGNQSVPSTEGGNINASQSASVQSSVASALPKFPNEGRWDAIIEREASANGIPAALVRAVIRQESRFIPTAKSSAGAVGLMQLMPKTATQLGVINREDPEESIKGGAKYLGQIWRKFSRFGQGTDQHIQIVAAGYNAGPNRDILQQGRIPEFRETQTYATNVLQFFRYYSDPTAPATYTVSPAGVQQASLQSDKVNQINKLVEPFLVRYNEQGILLKAKDSILGFTAKDAKGNEVPMTELPFKNFVKIKTNENPEKAVAEITNLISPKGFDTLMNISNAAASKLIPYIRLYRTKTKEENDEIEDVEFLFESNFANPTGKTRNYGYGLKEFTWNDNSFSHEGYSFDASMIIRFDSLSSFCKKRVGPKFINGVRKKSKEYSFMQLVYNLDLEDIENPQNHQANDETDSNQESQGDYTRIKIVVGWNKIKGDDTEDHEYDNGLKKKRVFYAYTTKHDVKINKDGTCDLVLNMQLAQDRESKDRLYSNILRNQKAAEEAVSPYKEEIKKAEQGAIDAQRQVDESLESSQENTDTIETAKQKEFIARKEYENKVIQQNKNIFSEFLNQMFNNNIIRCISISKDELDLLRQKGLDANVSIAANRIKEIEEFSIANQGKTKLFRLDSGLQAESILSKDNASQYYNEIVQIQEQSGDVFIPFFFLGDLLDIILENVNSNKPESKKLKLLVGPVILRDLTQKTFIEASTRNKLDTAGDEGARTINLADLPISFKFFMDWWLTSVPRDTSFNFTFQQFLTALQNQFLPLILNPYCFGKKYVGGETKFNTFSLTAVKAEGSESDPLVKEKNFRGAILEAKNVGNLVDGFVGENVSPNIVQYFYIDSRYEVRNQIGRAPNEIEDAKEGIYHLKMGAKLGLVKNISFTKEDMQYVSEANWQKEGKLGAGQFKFAYRAVCDMIGNIIFRPGMIVYVDPTFMLSGISKKDATRMGFNAYYSVLKTSNTLGVNGFRTSLQLKQAFPADEKTRGTK